MAAYLVVGGLPGVLYAGGIFLAAFVGAIAIVAGRAEEAFEPESEPTAAATRPPRRRRKKHIIAELEVELIFPDREEPAVFEVVRSGRPLPGGDVCVYLAQV